MSEAVAVERERERERESRKREGEGERGKRARESGSRGFAFAFALFCLVVFLFSSIGVFLSLFITSFCGDGLFSSGRVLSVCRGLGFSREEVREASKKYENEKNVYFRNSGSFFPNVSIQ